MSDSDKLKGAVLLADDPDMMAISSLLLSTAKRYAEAEYHNQPQELPLDASLDFILTHDSAILENIIAYYTRHAVTPPTIMLLDHPSSIAATDYAKLYPGVEIITIPQANLDMLDVTLNFELFAQVLHTMLNQRKP